MNKTNDQLFLEKAKKKHNNKYSYDKFVYVNSKTKGIITCPVHGDFEQIPNTHLNGSGCPACSGNTRYTPETFIQRAKEIHGDKYDYSKTVYTSGHNYVTITCPKHGDFQQKAYSHLSGSGCFKCMVDGHTSNQDYFLQKAKEVHGDKYDYSKTVYVGVRKKIIITCPKHGDFEQKTGCHLRGHGCPKCSPVALKDTETFIKEAKAIHGDKYNYSKVNYTSAHNKITLICPEHGEFEQVASTHLRGSGCPSCVKKIAGLKLSIFKHNQKHKIDTSELSLQENLFNIFLTKAKEVHGDKYVYNKDTFIDMKTEITIFCPEHGYFTQKPNLHLLGTGCAECIANKKREAFTLSKEEFIKRAISVHGNKHTYDKFVYVNSKTKGIITCPVHGDFEQTPDAHIRGTGCNRCSGKARYTPTLQEFLIKANQIHQGFYKYDFSTYKNISTKMTITCPLHGDFQQKPEKHLKGSGCYSCYKQKISKNLALTKEEFTEKARKIHGDKYNYDKVVYLNGRKKVIIICPKHGEFEQSPAGHINSKSGCAKCEGKAPVTLEDFIIRSNKKHNNFYDYSLVSVKKVKEKVTIICPKHGSFKQTVSSHLNGSGCPTCKSSKGEVFIKTILKEHNIDYVHQYRIPEVLNELYYDFYLPEYNLLIEFHGKQHYEYIPFFHRNGEDDFLKQKFRDDLVRSNARLFKYRYLEFNYKQLKDLGEQNFSELVIKNIRRFKRVK